MSPYSFQDNVNGVIAKFEREPVMEMYDKSKCFACKDTFDEFAKVSAKDKSTFDEFASLWYMFTFAGWLLMVMTWFANGEIMKGFEPCVCARAQAQAKEHLLCMHCHGNHPNSVSLLILAWQGASASLIHGSNPQSYWSYGRSLPTCYILSALLGRPEFQAVGLLQSPCKRILSASLNQPGFQTVGPLPSGVKGSAPSQVAPSEVDVEMAKFMPEEEAKPTAPPLPPIALHPPSLPREPSRTSGDE
eukprot:scaffold143967_cov18-Tisochrysis_lutea.AAC.1